jgi:hypothetical protein
MVGGLVGGAIYEGLTQLFISQSDAVQSWVGGFGLVLMGACIGALIAATRQAFSAGELRVLSGRREGTVREVVDSMTLGSYDGCDIYLPDAAIAKRHALVQRGASGFSIRLLPATPSAFVGGRPLAPGQEQPLRSGDIIQLGGTQVQFVGRDGTKQR